VFWGIYALAPTGSRLITAYVLDAVIFDPRRVEENLQIQFWGESMEGGDMSNFGVGIANWL
jgi:hypothetical protein